MGRLKHFSKTMKVYEIRHPYANKVNLHTVYSEGQINSSVLIALQIYLLG